MLWDKIGRGWCQHGSLGWGKASIGVVGPAIVGVGGVANGTSTSSGNNTIAGGGLVNGIWATSGLVPALDPKWAWQLNISPGTIGMVVAAGAIGTSTIFGTNLLFLFQLDMDKGTRRVVAVAIECAQDMVLVWTILVLGQTRGPVGAWLGDMSPNTAWMCLVALSQHAKPIIGANWLLLHRGVPMVAAFGGEIGAGVGIEGGKGIGCH